MYIKMAEDEDNKMVERWKADADGILIFVSSGSTLCYTTACINHKIIDWFVLCICGDVSRSICPRPHARSPRDLRILLRKYIPTVRRPQRFQYIHPLHSTQTSCLFSEVRCLGQLALVFELGHQPYMCPPGDLG